MEEELLLSNVTGQGHIHFWENQWEVLSTFGYKLNHNKTEDLL